MDLIEAAESTVGTVASVGPRAGSPDHLGCEPSPFIPSVQKPVQIRQCAITGDTIIQGEYMRDLAKRRAPKNWLINGAHYELYFDPETFQWSVKEMTQLGSRWIKDEFSHAVFFHSREEALEQILERLRDVT